MNVKGTAAEVALKELLVYRKDKAKRVLVAARLRVLFENAAAGGPPPDPALFTRPGFPYIVAGGSNERTYKMVRGKSCCTIVRVAHKTPGSGVPGSQTSYRLWSAEEPED